MNRFLLLAGLLFAAPALAQSPTRVGPLSVQNRLGEIANDGTGAQATARANLGLSGVPLTVPTSPLLGGAPGAFVPLGIGAGLTGAGSQLSVVYGTGTNTALQGSLRGVANGVAGLDAGGLVPLAQLPSLGALGAASVGSVTTEASTARAAEAANASSAAAAQTTANAALPTASAGPLATQPGASGSAAIAAALGFTPYSAANPAGYVNSAGAAGAAPVQSVAGRTGAIALGFTDLAGNPSSGQVTGGLGFTPLNPANNLSDILSAATARASLGLGSISTQSAAAVAITGGTIAGTPVSGASGAFSTLSASGTVSGAGVTALLAPYAPLASPSFTGSIGGASIALTGNATFGGTLGVTGATTLTGDLLTAGRFVASSGSLRFVNNGANGWNFQNAAGGSAFTINGSASALANQVTMVPQVAGNGPSIVATGTDTNIALKLQSKGTGAVQVNLSPFSVTPSVLSFSNGVAPAGSFSYTASASGALNTANPNPIVAFSLNGDTVSKDLNSGFFPFISVIKNWGGGSQQGQQQAFRVNMVQTGAVTGYTPPVNMQMVGTGLFADYSFNVGGTAPTTGNSIGAAYAMAVTTQLHPGATNYTLASNIEWDIEVDATQQNLTLGGTITAGDTITLTYTSTSIVGSPVSVVATAGTGDLLGSLVNKLVAAVNSNAALGVAGVSAQPDPTTNGVVDLFWQTQNATTVQVAVGGAATETAALGSVVAGASTRDRSNVGFASRGAGRSNGRDTILDFGTLNSTHGSSALTFLNLGVPSSVFPIAPGGGLLTINLQQMQAATSQPVWSPQLGRGFDLRLINWTQFAGSPLLSPGFNIGGTGNLNLQNAVISVTSTGLTLDVPGGRIGSGNPAVVSGGGGGAGGTTGNYFAGEIVQGVNGTDLNGGQYLITSVNASTGAVSPGGLTTLVQPSTTTASLGVAIPTIGGSGIGLTITPTAATNNALSLQPSGSATLIGGLLKWTGSQIVANGAVATTMTSIGPTGSHTTVQEWLQVQNSAGTTRYIPLY